ncbi:helix-turn-helix domain-containing protein [Sporolactobacillus sp. CQH2019]|uniref:helix-turn-helix domain-containing protein n=1 Tax=Sporolactobacillus sp. CQH2019 TaxID=3023512 RepID=UPI003FD55AE9
MTNFGMKVRIKLLEKDKSMRSLAGDLGITNAYLSDILRGNRKAEKQRKRIAKLLGIDLEKEKEATK